LPIDSLDLLAEQLRSVVAEVSNRSVSMDWNAASWPASKRHGMRNSNCVAIAPTATISNIIGRRRLDQLARSGNLSVKSNLSRRIHHHVNEGIGRRLEKSSVCGMT
jgi:ribonucleoside-diphosphate reductase alpha chain